MRPSTTTIECQAAAWCSKTGNDGSNVQQLAPHITCHILRYYRIFRMPVYRQQYVQQYMHQSCPLTSGSSSSGLSGWRDMGSRWSVSRWRTICRAGARVQFWDATRNG